MGKEYVLCEQIEGAFYFCYDYYHLFFGPGSLDWLMTVSLVRAHFLIVSVFVVLRGEHTVVMDEEAIGVACFRCLTSCAVNSRPTV